MDPDSLTVWVLFFTAGVLPFLRTLRLNPARSASTKTSGQTWRKRHLSGHQHRRCAHIR
jgi:hypothetical protein